MLISWGMEFRGIPAAGTSRATYEISTTPSLEEDPEWGEKDGDEDLANVRSGECHSRGMVGSAQATCGGRWH